MSDASQVNEESDELLHIYSALRKLNCLSKEDYPQLFPQKFLWKVLSERLGGLHELAIEICNDLFGQLGARGWRDGAIDVQNAKMRYPEFDEYFHTCLGHMYDLIMDLHWYEQLPGHHHHHHHHQQQQQPVAVASNTSADTDQYVEKFIAFQKLLNSSATKGRGKAKSGKAASRRSISPPARRRVQFEDLQAPTKSPLSPDTPHMQRSPPRVRTKDDRELRDNHSVFALDLLLYGVEIFIHHLVAALDSWATDVRADLDKQIDSLFESNTRIRSRNLQTLARTIKIYNDVHLTVLDHLNEIKRTYLIRIVRGTLLARDSLPLLENYKQPRIAYYMRRLHTDIEARILRAPTSQCLQIFFNLIICEINVPPVELRGPTKTRHHKGGKDKDKLASMQENVMNFIGSWLKVDDILFGVSQQKEQSKASEIEDLLKEKRPRIVAKSSTLSTSENPYKSSSRILTQMDNLSEFMREFLHTVARRLGNRQQLSYFFDCITTGIIKFFDIISIQLEKQLANASSSLKQPTDPSLAEEPQANIDSMAAKIRCLKFLHIMGAAGKIIETERSRFELATTQTGLETKLAKFTATCIGPPQ